MSLAIRSSAETSGHAVLKHFNSVTGKASYNGLAYRPTKSVDDTPAKASSASPIDCVPCFVSSLAVIT